MFEYTDFYEDAARDTLIEAMKNTVGNAKVILTRDVSTIWIGRTSGKAQTE